MQATGVQRDASGSCLPLDRGPGLCDALATRLCHDWVKRHMVKKHELVLPGPLRGWLAEAAARGMTRSLARVREGLARQTERARGLLDEASQLELRLLRKLEPIIDDLGDLVRLELAEARARLGQPDPRDTRRAPEGPEVIDVEARPVDRPR